MLNVKTFKLFCIKAGTKKADLLLKYVADAAKDCNISAPGLRTRILTDVHVNKYHWIFDKNSTHYK